MKFFAPDSMKIVEVTPPGDGHASAAAPHPSPAVYVEPPGTLDPKSKASLGTQEDFPLRLAYASNWTDCTRYRFNQNSFQKAEYARCP